MHTPLAILASFLLLAAADLHAQAPAAEPAAKAQAPAPLDAKSWDHYGSGIVEGANVPLAEALRAPEQYTGKTLRLEGPITAVCQVKGCWLHLGAQEPTVMVKFKDYAFFVPKDAVGRTAVLEGTMTFVQETVEQTRHYLEDAGKHDEAAKVTVGRKVYSFVASGVAIKKPQPLDAKSWDHYGSGIVEGANVPLAEALRAPEQYTGKTLRLEGPITAVCQVKGCWLHLGAQEPTVMVKFKDYAFFVPKDAVGRTAVLEGTMTFVQETVEQTRHYLEDAGKHDEAAKVTVGRKVYSFVASGVAIKKPAN